MYILTTLKTASGVYVSLQKIVLKNMLSKTVTIKKRPIVKTPNNYPTVTKEFTRLTTTLHLKEQP